MAVFPFISFHVVSIIIIISLLPLLLATKPHTLSRFPSMPLLYLALYSCLLLDSAAARTELLLEEGADRVSIEHLLGPVPKLFKVNATVAVRVQVVPQHARTATSTSTTHRCTRSGGAGAHAAGEQVHGVGTLARGTSTACDVGTTLQALHDPASIAGGSGRKGPSRANGQQCCGVLATVLCSTPLCCEHGLRTGPAACPERECGAWLGGSSRGGSG